MIRLSDEQWERIRNYFPEEHIPDGRPGRKPISTRRVLGSLVDSQHRRTVAHAASDLSELQNRASPVSVLMLQRGFASNSDGCCQRASRQRGAGRRREFHRRDLCNGQGRGRGDRPDQAWKRHENHGDSGSHGLPLSVSTHAANHHEVRLVQLCFDFYMIEAKPEIVIGDRAYDSDPLGNDLRKDGIELVAPHRSNRRKCATQDGRRLRRYARRWLVERFFAWIQWQRRILVRWEFYPKNFLGFVQLACLVILFKRF